MVYIAQEKRMNTSKHDSLFADLDALDSLLDIQCASEPDVPTGTLTIRLTDKIRHWAECGCPAHEVWVPDWERIREIAIAREEKRRDAKRPQECEG